MKFLQLFKGTKQTYFLYTFLGIGIFVIDFLIMVNWMAVVRGLLGNPNLGYDHQPEAFKFLNKLLGYLLWIVVGILFVRGFIKKNLVIAISVGLGFLLSYISLIAYLLGGPVIKDYANRIPFDALKWQNEELVNSTNPIRVRMVDDLLKKYNLIGMPKDKINNLLGTPLKTGYFSNYDYVYWLGPERGIVAIDSEFLVIKFENEKVIEARIVGD